MGKAAAVLKAPPELVHAKEIDLGTLSEEQGLPPLETSGRSQSLQRVMKEALQKVADSLPTVFAAMAEELRITNRSNFMLTVARHLRVDDSTFRFHVRGTSHQGSPCERIFQLSWKEESPAYFQLFECKPNDTPTPGAHSLSRIGLVRVGEAALEMAMVANGGQIENSVLSRVVH